MREDDFELADGVFIRLWDKEERDKGSLSKEEQNVISVWHASGIIGNGGFQYFYEQEIDPEKTACAYEEVNAPKCAELIRLSASVLPEKLDWDERVEFIESKQDVFDSLDSAFWDADKETPKKVADYIRANRPKISV